MTHGFINVMKLYVTIKYGNFEAPFCEREFLYKAFAEYSGLFLGWHITAITINASNRKRRKIGCKLS